MNMATLALEPAGPYGYCVAYPGAPSVLHGEFAEYMPFLDAVDLLLQNGLPWRILVPAPFVYPLTPGESSANSFGHVIGAVWYLAAKHGAQFHEIPFPSNVTDGQLTKAGLWRRGMSAANRAARLLMEIDTP